MGEVGNGRPAPQPPARSTGNLLPCSLQEQYRRGISTRRGLSATVRRGGHCGQGEHVRHGDTGPHPACPGPRVARKPGAAVCQITIICRTAACDLVAAAALTSGGAWAVISSSTEHLANRGRRFERPEGRAGCGPARMAQAVTDIPKPSLSLTDILKPLSVSPMIDIADSDDSEGQFLFCDSA